MSRTMTVTWLHLSQLMPSELATVMRTRTWPEAHKWNKPFSWRRYYVLAMRVHEKCLVLFFNKIKFDPIHHLNAIDLLTAQSAMTEGSRFTCISWQLQLRSSSCHSREDCRILASLCSWVGQDQYCLNPVAQLDQKKEAQALSEVFCKETSSKNT